MKAPYRLLQRLRQQQAAILGLKRRHAACNPGSMAGAELLLTPSMQDIPCCCKLSPGCLCSHVCVGLCLCCQPPPSC